MRKITTITKVYDILELDKTAFKNAKNEFYSDDDTIQLNSDCFYECTKDDLYECFGIDAKLQYSLSYCQGDGLSFDCDNILTDKVYNHLLKQFTKQQRFIIKFLKDYGYKFYTKNTDNHYCYASKRDLQNSINCYAYSNFKEYYPSSKLKENDFDDNIAKIEDILTDFYLDLCKQYEKDGYNQIYYVGDDNEFIQLCKDNGYEFLIDGRMY